MNIPTAIWRHLLRPLLVMLLIGLLFSVIWLDASVFIGAGSGAHELARHLLGVGILIVLLEAFHCGLNWRRVPSDNLARDVGALRCAGATLAILLLAASWFLRTSSQPASTLAMALALAAVTTLFLTTWLGLEILLRYVAEPHPRARHNPTAPLRPTRTMPPMNNAPPLTDLTSSVAGEEDPGAAVDTPAPPPRTSMPGVATRR